MFLRKIQDWLALERNVSIMILSSALTVSGNALWMPFLPIFLISRLNLSIFEIGGLYSVGALFLTVSALTAGYVSDLVGRKRILVLGSFLLPLIPFFFTMAKSWIQALLIFSLYNVATGLVQPTLSTLLAESVSRRKRGMALAATFTFPSFPAAVAPSIAGTVIQSFGWSIVFYSGAIFLIGGAIIIALFVKETAKIQKTSEISKPSLATKLKNIWHDRVFLVLIIASAFISFSGEALRPYIAIFSAEVIGMSIFTFGAMFSIVTIVVGIFSIFGGKITDILGRKPIICISEALESIFILGFAFSLNVQMALLMYVIFVAVDTLDVAAPRAWVADISNDYERGWRMGLLVAFASIIRIPAPFLGGWLYTLTPRAVFYLEAVVSITAMLITFRLKEKV